MWRNWNLVFGVLIIRMEVQIWAMGADLDSSFFAGYFVIING